MLNDQRAAAPWGDYDCLVIQFLGFEHRQSQAYRLFMTGDESMRTCMSTNVEMPSSIETVAG